MDLAIGTNDNCNNHSTEEDRVLVSHTFVLSAMNINKNI